MQMPTLRRPRPMRPPVSIHMMPDFSAYDSYNTQSVSAPVSGTAQPVGDLYSFKSLKRKRSESTDDSDDGEDRDCNYHQTRHPSFGRPQRPHPVAESGYTPSKSDECGHVAKRARLADDFAELRLRRQSLPPTSGITPVSMPLWAPPVIEERESASPPLPHPPVEIDLTGEYVHVQPRRGAQVAPHPPAPILLDPATHTSGVLRGEVEEVVSPGVWAERSRNGTTTDRNGNGNDIKMHGTSSYEPEKDRASSRFFRPPTRNTYMLTSPPFVHRNSNNRPR